MTYLDAISDARTQYAVMSGQIDDRNEQEVVEFLEGIMRKAAVKVPDNGYIVFKNMYAYFARKIENGKESANTCDLENVLALVDQGLLRKFSVDKTRSATYYEPEHATLAEMQALYKETSLRLEHALEEYQRRLKAHTGTGDMQESVAHLTRRTRQQSATIQFLTTRKR